MADEDRPAARSGMMHPVPCLLIGSGLAALITSIVEVLWAAATLGVGRLRDLWLPWAISRWLGGPERDGIDDLPAIVNWPFYLDHAAGSVRFLVLAIAGNLAIVWCVAALTMPLVLAVRRIVRPSELDGFGDWLWRRAFPLAAPVAISLPAVFGAVWHAAGPEYRGLSAAAALTIGTFVWLTLMAVFPRPKAVRRFVKVCLLSSTTVVALALLAAAATFMLSPRPPATGQGKPAPGLPNILLISIDSLRADHVRCYGYGRPTTPEIDTVAKEGVTFRTTVAPTSWTLPSHVTLLTALSSDQHGVTGDYTRMNDGLVSLAQVLWRTGYATAGAVSGPYMHARYGFARGFDHYDDSTVVRLSHLGATSPKLMRLAFDYLYEWDSKGRTRPFFLFLHMWDVHYDYTPPPPYDTMFDPDYKGTVTAEHYESDRRVHRNMDPRDLEHVIALYDGEIRYTDLHIGKLLKHLERFGVLDETIIVITADHGDEFFEHGKKGHKKALYDETILVPLVIRYPAKIPGDRVVDRQVRLMDVAPTILSLAGIEQPDDFGAGVPGNPHNARDLTPLMDPADAESSPDLWAFSDLLDEQASVRTQTHKLIASIKEPRRFELYDLRSDPGERANVYGRRPAFDADLATTLFDWRQAATRAGGGNAKALRLGKEQEERLRSLGYIK